jgi:hypothetical protein
MGSDTLRPMSRVLAGILAAELIGLFIYLVARGLRWSSLWPGAFFVALLVYAAATGRWVHLFRRSSGR